MAREVVYLDHDNTVDRILVADDVAQSLSNVTKIIALFGTKIIESKDAAAGPIKWNQGGYDTGEIRFVLRNQPIPPGDYDVPVITYDASNPNGIVWDYIKFTIKITP